MSIYRYIYDDEGMPLGGKFVPRAEIYYEKINSDVKSFLVYNPDKSMIILNRFL